jgi:hypothetical protein
VVAWALTATLVGIRFDWIRKGLKWSGVLAARLTWGWAVIHIATAFLEWIARADYTFGIAVIIVLVGRRSWFPAPLTWAAVSSARSARRKASS